jgi:enterochelin esterase-like enzyme
VHTAAPGALQHFRETQLHSLFSGKTRPNRRHVLIGMGALGASTQMSWASEPTADPGSITYYPAFESEHVTARDVSVWLPAEEFRTGPLPVIYAHDGGNLFDPAVSYSGTAWELDQAMSALAAEGIGPAIVVAISSAPNRSREYNSETIFGYLPDHIKDVINRSCEGELMSGAYLKFIVEELKPFIDANFETVTGPEGTFMLGSSMGGIIAIEALAAYPTVFSAAAAMSAHMFLIGPASQVEGFEFPEDTGPSIEAAVERFATDDLPDPGTHRIWFDRGTVDLDSMYGPTHDRLKAGLLARGYVEGEDLEARVFDETGHFETWWQARLPEVLTFLLKSA